jgi:hypothetical protein
VCMRNQPARVTIELLNATSNAEVRVLGENRSIPLRDGRCEDDFAPYGVHLYCVGGGK